MSRIAIVLMACLVLSVMSWTAVGAATKLKEPEFGKIYSIKEPDRGNTWTFNAEYGDNITLNFTSVPGNTTDYGVTLKDYISTTLYFVSSSCDTEMGMMGGGMWKTSGWSIWFISGHSTVYNLDVVTGMAGNPAVNYTISKVNATIGGQSVDISKLEQAVATLNQTVNGLNNSMNAISANISSLSEHLQQSDSNLSNLQKQLSDMAAQFKALSDNLTALKARLDGLNIPEEVNLSGIQQNLTELSASYSSLYEDLTELANQTGNVTYQNVTYENKTLVTNETVIYAYDNGTLGNLSKGLEDLGKRMAEVNKSLPEELAKMKNETKKDNNKSRDSISREVGGTTAAMGAGVGLMAGLGAGAGTSALIGRRDSVKRIKERDEIEDVPTGGFREPQGEFPKVEDKGGGK